jgi:hypothetical protein
LVESKVERNFKTEVETGRRNGSMEQNAKFVTEGSIILEASRHNREYSPEKRVAQVASVLSSQAELNEAKESLTR